MVEGPDPKVRFLFRSQIRLVHQTDFDAVFSDGEVVADSTLVIHGRRRPNSRSRMGLSISKKVGHAPLRNRWKRLIREAFRLQQHVVPQSIDFVVRPKRGASPDAEAISKSLRKLLLRLDHRLDRDRSKPTP